MTLDLKLCAELLELDGKRTPGDWSRTGPFKARSGPVFFVNSGKHCIARLDSSGKEPGHNSAFILAAPKLAEQLKAALKERERLRSALQDLLNVVLDSGTSDHWREVTYAAKTILSETEATR